MDCRRCQSLIEAFLRRSLEPDENDEFVRHVKSCPDCRGELEVYYTVSTVVAQLDSDAEDENIDYKESLDRMLVRRGTSKKKKILRTALIIGAIAFVFIVLFIIQEMIM